MGVRMHGSRPIHALGGRRGGRSACCFGPSSPLTTMTGGGPACMDDDRLTLSEARAAYLARNNLGDGGYDAPSVRVRFGLLVIDMPNTRARRRAVPLHDLHHALTGYSTDWRGECAISGWEVAAGCGRERAARGPGAASLRR